jgi:hypothetical protein
LLEPAVGLLPDDTSPPSIPFAVEIEIDKFTFTIDEIHVHVAVGGVYCRRQAGAFFDVAAQSAIAPDTVIVPKRDFLLSDLPEQTRSQRATQTAR